MAENSASASPSKVPASGGGDAAIAPANSNPNLPSPQIPPSTSMGVGDLSQINSPQLSQSHPLSPAAALDYASKQQSIQSQQQQPLPSSQQPQSQLQIQSQQQQQQKQQAQQPNMSFQMQQSLQRSGSMPRLSQIQQQLGASAAAGAMRQHAGMYGGQMNLGGAQIQQQQLAAAAAAGGMGRSGIMTQAAQLPMLPGQTTQHFNLQSQMLTQPRQKSLLQAGQFNPGNTSVQALQGMQNMGMISNLSMNPQVRAFGQRIVHGQIRQQQLQQQIALTSPQKLPGQSLPRTPSAAALNSQMSGLTQNGQSTMVQTTLSQQQQWLKHLQPSLPSPVSPSYHLQQQRQQQSFLPQQLASSQHHQKPMTLTQQQISQLMQQQPQPQLGGQQQHLLQQQQIQQIQQLQQQQQLQSPRLAGSAVQNPLSLSGSQEEAPASGVTGGNSSQGTEATNQLLGKRKIHDLVMQVDPHGKLDPEVEDLLLQIADDFIDSVTTFACSLAKHRKSSTLDTKDVLLHLEKNWNLTVPGYSREERKYPKTSLSLDIHKRRRNVVRESAETHPSGGDVGGSKFTNKQQVNNSGSDHPINPSPVAEQLSLPVVGSQIVHKPQRF
ncbi:transcription initiation factor TFIID subunit 12b-like [Curcuma longa]|uniref:transcription initiation factor TFIID subunit 12b-like n=1 Tax=Curcuma longa TaxID=136217 RepID=UPI003D9E3702